MSAAVDRFLALVWRCNHCGELTAGSTKCVQCKALKRRAGFDTRDLTLRALAAITAVLVHELQHGHDGVVLRLGYMLERAYERRDEPLMVSLCECIEALNLGAP